MLPNSLLEPRQRAIQLTLALTFFYFATSTATRVALTLYALEIGASASTVGVLGGLFFLFPLLLSWAVGALIDRTGVRGPLLFAAACATVSLLLPYFIRALPALYVAAALTGLALSFFHVTLQNLIGTLSQPEARARNFSNFSLAAAVTSFYGPMLAGFAIDKLGPAAACLVVASQPIAAATLLLAWGHLFPGGKPPARAGSGKSGTLFDANVRYTLIVGALVQLGIDLFQFYIPIYGHSIGLSASTIGVTLATFAAAAFVVRLFLAWLIKSVASEVLFAFVFFTGAISFALAPFSGNAIRLCLVAFLFGLGMGIGAPLGALLMFTHSAEGRSGQTLGVRLTANNIVRFSVPILFGAITSALGVAAGLWIAAVIMASGGLLARRGTRSG